MSKKKYVYSYNKVCEVCGKEFVTQRYSTKICSEECVKKKLSQKRKYTNEQVELAIALRLQGMIIPEIVKQTGIKKPSLQKIFQEQDIKLSEEAKKEALSRRWITHEPVIDGKKECSKCKIFKPLDEFHRNNDRLTGVVSACKDCCKIFYQKNCEEIKQRVAEYRENNPEKIKEMYEIYYENNKEYYIEKAIHWALENPEKRRGIEDRYNKKTKKEKVARTANYRARKKQAMPVWLTEDQKKEIKEIYKNRPDGYCVDHIVPIAGENVSGLHVPWNLQYLPARLNESKGNKFNPQIEVSVCYQYKRKLETRIEDIDNGMPADSTIDEFDFYVEKFNEGHRTFIERYEWLGTVGYSPQWVFTARINGILGGVIIITESNAYTNKKDGKKFEAQITRGATASWTPKNLGSKLLMFSCNWMVQNTTKRLFFGYSDHAAGEIGTIYQACNFTYLGNYFGAKIQYRLESGKLVNSRYFRKTSTFKRYAKELNIEWKKEWSKENGYMNRNTIPVEIFDILKKKGKVHQNSCEQIVQPSKGKYVLILGKDKRDKKNIQFMYMKIFGKFEPYPKRTKTS
jgi:hypothetical protein